MNFMGAKSKNIFSHPLLSLSGAALLALSLSSGVRGQDQATSMSPRVWQGPLSIPTYELGPPNPYPALLDWQRRKWRPVYPYPFLDTLSNKRIDKTYKAVYLENEYLRVSVLPELRSEERRVG